MTSLEMSPNLGRPPPRRGQIGANRDEQQRAAKSRSTSESKEQRADAAGRSGTNGGELPTGEATVETISETRTRQFEARQCGAGIEPGEAEKISAAGSGLGAEEVFRRGGEAIRADVGGGASGNGRRSERGWGNTATVDAGRGVVESEEEERAAPPEAGAERTLWRTGADGRKLSRLAGRARTERLPDGHGGGRHKH